MELQGNAGEEGHVLKMGSVCIAHPYKQVKTLIANSLLNACYTPLDSKCYVTLRAKLTGHNSVLFVVDLVLVTLCGKMCCCSLVQCAPHCGGIVNPYYIII